MAIKTETVPIRMGTESYDGYFAAPETGQHPGVLVLQEIFGVNEHIKAVTERLAEEGYACLAPDLFWRQQPNFTSGYSDEEIEHARGIRGDVDLDVLTGDLRGAFHTLRARDECVQDKVGVIGFCFGGLMTYLSAARLQPACSVSYYGGGITNHLTEYFGIRTPIMFHFGELDQSIPMDQVEQVKQTASQAMIDSEVYTYPNAGHGFNCDLRASYHEPSAKEAWHRTLAFFQRHLH